MNFDWTESEQALRDAVEAVFSTATRRDLAALETANLAGVEAMVRSVLPKLAATGYLSLGVGASAHADAMRLIAGQEIVAAASGPLFLATEASVRLCGGLVAAHGDATAQREILGPLQRGEAIGAVARADAEDASPATADLAGDQYVIQGHKAYVTNGPFADWIAVQVLVKERVALALVEREAPGLTRGERLATLGQRGLAVCPVTLQDVRVPRSRLLGPFADDTALADLQRAEDLILAVSAVGLAQRGFEAAKEHAQSHQRGGKPLMAYQAVRHQLAELLTLTQTAQLATHRAAWLVADATGPDAWDADNVVRCAKAFAAEAAEQVATGALRIVAGHGYVSGHPVEQVYRDATHCGLAGTTTTVCRMQIADAMLERYQP